MSSEKQSKIKAVLPKVARQSQEMMKEITNILRPKLTDDDINALLDWIEHVNGSIILCLCVSKPSFLIFSL